MKEENKEKIICVHCGEECKDDSIRIGDKIFCCYGCKGVYEILNGSDLKTYYSIEENPGSPLQMANSNKFDYLKDESVVNKLISFKDNEITKIIFDFPQIHCSACIWLIENLYRIEPAIIESKVNFLKKNALVTFKHNDIDLNKVVRLLAKIGYEPRINLDSLDGDEGNKQKTDNTVLLEMGVAGFAFINVMMFSFPEYLSIDQVLGEEFAKFFGYLNFLFSIPVLLYSSRSYFKSAYGGLLERSLNIDVPIVVGFLTIFIRSCVELFVYEQPGYFDSFTGLIFLLLVGNYFKQIQFDSLTFDRTYKSYFPISINRLKGETTGFVTVDKLVPNDVIKVKNGEIIPADAILFSESSSIDYSFVTGESKPVDIKIGTQIYAGGKNLGSSIEVEVVKKYSQSYLTELWNKSKNDEQFSNKLDEITDKISRYFSYGVLTIALTALGIWLFIEAETAVQVFTSVLIVACPCALALSAPFTYGTALRLLSRKKFFIRKPEVVEKLSKVNAIIFDKTGTLTIGKDSITGFNGDLSEKEKLEIFSLASNSKHPISISISEFLDKKEDIAVKEFKEEIGKGVSGVINGKEIKLGSRKYLGIDENSDDKVNNIYVSINGELKGSFIFANIYREGLDKIVDELKGNYKLYVLTGDGDFEKENLEKIFGTTAELKFSQSPFQKLEFIRELHGKGLKTLMIGDGLNDAGALNESFVGVAITDDVNNFTPASDVIMDSKFFKDFSKFLTFSKKSVNIIMLNFSISIIYNIIGLSFAISGILTPLVSAIIMPISSISVVTIAVIGVRMVSPFKRKG